jgi:alkyl sulfatase BDS1-like metallo-beta-lactamase superfamily hydrolase
VKLPADLALSQGHGKVSWSVRGTWEKLSGWYLDDSVANLYHVPPEAVHADIIELLGGPDPLADRAREHLAAGKALEALRLLDIASADANDNVLRVRIDVLKHLLADAEAGLNNYSEVRYLQADIRDAEARLSK